MPPRVVPLASNNYYHIYNRGIAYSPTFQNKRDYKRFVTCIDYYRFKKTSVKLSRFLELPLDEQEAIFAELYKKSDFRVSLVAYVLMPNHFHLLLRQEVENGISFYINQTMDSYVKYFNTKYNRGGPLFQGRFKAVRIETDEQLIHVSRYIHLNPYVSLIVREKDLLSYPWSSLRNYIYKENIEDKNIETKPILSYFGSLKNAPQKYLRFIQDHADYAKKLEKLKHLTIE